MAQSVGHFVKIPILSDVDVNELPEGTGDTAEAATSGNMKNPCKRYPARVLWW